MVRHSRRGTRHNVVHFGRLDCASWSADHALVPVAMQDLRSRQSLSAQWRGGC